MIMNAKKIQEAYHKKTPVTLKRNVQAFRKAMYPGQGGFYADPTELAGKPLRICFVEMRAPIPFVRLTSPKGKTPMVKHPGGEPVPLNEMMIPVTALKELPKKRADKK